MISSDLLAKFRARVTHWCVEAQREKDESGSADSNSHTILKPPFRLISHGHELTPDLDMKTLWELGVRDQQVLSSIVSLIILHSSAVFLQGALLMVELLIYTL